MAALVGAGCSTTGEKSGEDIAATGPTVVDVKISPETVELNQSLEPMQTAEIVADVKDFTSRVTDVRLRFLRAPLEIPMQHVGGTTWRAQLSSEQLRLLAVGGKTIRYETNIIAKNEQGKVAVSPEPVEVAIKTPEMTRRAG